MNIYCKQQKKQKFPLHKMLHIFLLSTVSLTVNSNASEDVFALTRTDNEVSVEKIETNVEELMSKLPSVSAIWGRDSSYFGCQLRAAESVAFMIDAYPVRPMLSINGYFTEISFWTAVGVLSAILKLIVMERENGTKRPFSLCRTSITPLLNLGEEIDATCGNPCPGFPVLHSEFPINVFGYTGIHFLDGGAGECIWQRCLDCESLLYSIVEGSKPPEIFFSIYPGPTRMNRYDLIEYFASLSLDDFRPDGADGWFTIEDRRLSLLRLLQLPLFCEAVRLRLPLPKSPQSQGRILYAMEAGNWVKTRNFLCKQLPSDGEIGVFPFVTVWIELSFAEIVLEFHKDGDEFVLGRIIPFGPRVAERRCDYVLLGPNHEFICGSKAELKKLKQKIYATRTQEPRAEHKHHM
jgi:hypothetical protein